MKPVRFRGGVTIHTATSCSFGSFGSWEIDDESIMVHGLFQELVVVAKENISEIRMSQLLTPEFTVVCSDGEGTQLLRLSVFFQSTGRRIAECLLLAGYQIDHTYRFNPRGQYQKDEQQYGLYEDRP